LGTLVGTIIGMNPALLFLRSAGVVFRLVFFGYQMSAGVGVWRSANALLARSGGHTSITFADSMKAVAAKVVFVLLIVIHGILLLRTLSILASYSRLNQ
jgi:ABC-type nickel/cobalt efflux system permease component RcnA